MARSGGTSGTPAPGQDSSPPCRGGASTLAVQTCSTIEEFSNPKIHLQLADLQHRLSALTCCNYNSGNPTLHVLHCTGVSQQSGRFGLCTTEAIEVLHSRASALPR